MWTLTIGPQAPLGGAYRGTAASAIVAAGVIAIGVPTLAGYRIALQSRGEQPVLFSPIASPAAIRRELAHRCAGLRSRRRWLLPQLRQRLIVAATTPAAGPPDPGRRQPPAVPTRVRAVALGGLAVIITAAGLLAQPSPAAALGKPPQSLH